MEHIRKLERTEMKTLKLICAIRLQDRLMNADLWNRFGIEGIGDVRSGRLHMFGHVERKPAEDF